MLNSVNSVKNFLFPELYPGHLGSLRPNSVSNSRRFYGFVQYSVPHSRLGKHFRLFYLIL